MSTIACYVRVSGGGDGEQLTGLASQEDALRRYCRANNFTPFTFYSDVISGASTSRPRFDLMQKRIFAGRIKTVIVWRLDRITRAGSYQGLTILNGWLKRGVRVISITEQFDFHGEVGKMLAGIFFSLASMQREQLRENTRRGLERARQAGKMLGRKRRIHLKDITPLMEQGKTKSEIAEELQCSRQAIYAAIRRESKDE